MTDVWGAVARGRELGEADGQRIRDRRYGRVYNQGGYGAVEKEAASSGDWQGADVAATMGERQRRFSDEGTIRAYRRMQEIAPWARNVLRAARGMDPQRRAAFLARPDVRQRFLDFGFSEEQLTAGIQMVLNPDEAAADQAFQELESAFTQHENPEWSLQQVGGSYQALAIDPSSGDIREGGRIEGAPRVRPITPEERAQLGIPDNVAAQVNEATGEVDVIHRPPQGRAGSGGYYPDDGYDYPGEGP